jgi:simple sugar transport system substrate-binding protein
VRRALWLLVLLACLAGCGGTSVRRDAPVIVAGGSAPAQPQPGDQPGPPRGAVRIAVVTHGQASSPFWAIVRNGVDAAARQLDVLVSYRAPEVYSVSRMEQLIGDAIASKPDGLVVSLPDPALGRSVRRAVDAGIPTITINSGFEVARRLGVLAHVGQPEELAGFRAGRRLVAAGAHRVLCVNVQVGNTGLDARCRGLARAMRAGGGTSAVLPVDDQSPATPERIATAVASGGIDGLLTLNATSGSARDPGHARRGPRPQRHHRHLRPRAGRARRRSRRPAGLRRRPAAVPAGLLADRDAGSAGPLRAAAGAGRADPDRAELRHAQQRRAGHPAQPALDPLTAQALPRGPARARIRPAAAQERTTGGRGAFAMAGGHELGSAHLRRRRVQGAGRSTRGAS